MTLHELATLVLFAWAIAFVILHGETILETCRPAARKVGGIWFARAWRVRVSFCIARRP